MCKPDISPLNPMLSSHIPPFIIESNELISHCIFIKYTHNSIIPTGTKNSVTIGIAHKFANILQGKI